MWTATLPNGLRVGGRQQDTTLSAVCVAYRVGSADDPEGYTGLAHLTEHLMFGATARMPDGFHGLLESAGATYVNAYTANDETKYCVSLPDVSLERALFGEGERMAFLLESVTEEQVATQQRVVANEALERGEGSTSHTLARLHLNELYRDDPAQLLGLRGETDVDDIQLANIQWFHQRYYGPSNAALSIVSSRPRSEVMALVNRYFGHIRGQAAPARPAPERITTGTTGLPESVDIEFESRLNDSRLRIVWPTAGYLTEDDFALDYVARRLQHVLSAELYSADVLGTSVRQHSNYGRSYFRIEVRIRRHMDLDELLARIDRHVRALQRTLLSDEELLVTRARIGQQGDGAVDWAGAMAKSLLFEERIWDRHQLRARHNEITAEQVRSVAQRWLPLSRRIVLRAINDATAHYRGSTSIRRHR